MATAEAVDRAVLNRRLYEKLVDLVGSEEEIRLRQRAFKIMDAVNAFGDVDSYSISSGSLAEGLDLKGSDEDQLIVLKFVDVVPYEVEESLQVADDVTVVSMEMDTNFHGYAKLFLTQGHCNVHNEYISKCLVKLDGRCVLSSSKFRKLFNVPGLGVAEHGPCVNNGPCDFAMSLSGKVWPRVAKDRLISPKSKNWISDMFAEELVMGDRCIYVPVGPRVSEEHNYLWRVSLCVSERKLVLSMNHVQTLCYGLLKIVLKEGIEKQMEAKDVLCSYFMKTCLFWLIAETDNDDEIWCVGNLFSCFEMCLDRLIEWVSNRTCPNYIITEENMFLGKVNDGNKDILLSCLRSFREGGFKQLTQCESLASLLTSSPRLSLEEREAKLDFICFRVIYVYPFDSRELLCKAIEKVESLYDSECHQYIKGVIAKLRATLHQELAQMLQMPEDLSECKEVRRRQREHLLKACGTDVCCGFSLLASFYHKQGCHYTALEILNAVTRKFTAFFILARRDDYSEEERKSYVASMCGKGFTLEEKMKSAIACIPVLLDNSSVLPDEFLPEIQNHYRPLVIVPPSVFVYALKYLCYHHLKDENKARESLNMLEDVVERKYLILERHYSAGVTILGACYETNGDLENAYRCYRLAQSCVPICRSVEYRLNRLEQRICTALSNHP